MEMGGSRSGKVPMELVSYEVSIWRRERAMVTLSRSSKKSKSSSFRMAVAVLSSGGSLDHALKEA